MTFFRKASKAGKLRSGLLKLKAEIILSNDGQYQHFL
jgi:hypothetical protein